MEESERITSDLAVMGGVPCIRDTRIPVAPIAGRQADGMTVGEIREEYPQLTEADVRTVLDWQP